MENTNKKNDNSRLSEYEERKEKLKKLEEKNIKPYPARAERSHLVRAVLDDFDNFEKDKTKVTLCGRLRSKRVHGNLSFVDLEDESGKIQVAISKKEIGENYKSFAKLVDNSDFMQFTGTVFTTEAGQQTLMTSEWKLLTKALRGVPTEHFGLKDEDERYRKRYLDLLLNPEKREMFKRRAKFWQAIRKFMTDKNFFEVETPTIETTTGGAEARPFETYHNDFNLPVYMRICIGELWQKRLMAAGFEKTFEIGKAYRNEGSSPDHMQEFTNMEFYWAYADYNDGMKLVQELYRFIAQEVYGRTDFEARGHKFDLADEWVKIDYVEEIEKQTGVNVLTATKEELANKLAELNVKYDGENKERLMDSLWKYCRANIAGPAFLINLPVEVSPLAKVKEDSPRQTERFQPILGGAEVGNGYSELNDPIDQRKRFEEQKKLLEAGDEEAMMPDWEFVEMLEYGMPPTCGLGMGERLFAFFENQTLREATLFPLMKPKDASEGETGKSKQTKVAVALVNKGLKLESWQEMNTIAHLNAAFAARKGKELFLQDEIITKDQKKIKLNIQHAIMIKEAESNNDILELVKSAKELNLDVSEFTREMIETTDDKKVIEKTAQKYIKEVDYLGVLIFGKKSTVDKLTDKFNLFQGTCGSGDGEISSEGEDLGIDLEKANELVDKYITDPVTKLHSQESAAIMRGLAKHFGEDDKTIEKWGTIGLLHDLDWDETKEKTEEHSLRTAKYLQEVGASDFLIETIKSHNYGYEPCEELKDKKRVTRLQHSLAAAETLTGLVVASSLILPTKTVKDVKLKSLKKKFKNAKFAERCDRGIISECENIGIDVDDFLEIGLVSLQEVAEDLGI